MSKDDIKYLKHVLFNGSSYDRSVIEKLKNNKNGEDILNYIRENTSFLDNFQKNDNKIKPLKIVQIDY